MLKESYPFYLANEAVYANEDLVVIDKYSGKDATRVAMASPDDYPAPPSGTSDRARGAGTYLPEVPEAVGPETGLGCPHRGSATGGHLGAE
ncbi:MAG: hypothetical protein ACE1Y4_15865 [Lysobacterales bacterium]